MKKINAISLLLIGSTITLLSACSSMTSLHNKLADAELQKKQLANGQTVYVDMNVTPTDIWHCKEVGTPQYYNWAELKMKGQFQFSGPYGLLTNNALAYANQQNLQTNYINLQVPTESTFSTGHGRFSNHFNLRPHAQAVATYYSCENINPQHTIGFQEKKDVSIRTGD